MVRRTIADAEVDRRDEFGALTWQVRHRGWAVAIRLTTFPDRRSGRLDYAVARVPKGVDGEALAYALDTAKRHTHRVSLPPGTGGKVSGFHRDDVPKLVARVLSQPLSAHDMATLTLKCLAVEDPPETVEAQVRAVRAAETEAEFDRTFTALLVALTANGSRRPAEDARLRFGLCYETELRKRRDWQADFQSRA